MKGMLDPKRLWNNRWQVNVNLFRNCASVGLKMKEKWRQEDEMNEWIKCTFSGQWAPGPGLPDIWPAPTNCPMEYWGGRRQILLNSMSYVPGAGYFRRESGTMGFRLTIVKAGADRILPSLLWPKIVGILYSLGASNRCWVSIIYVLHYINYDSGNDFYV